MIKQIGKYLSFTLGFIACFFSFCYAQQPVIKTSLDKNEILIGEQFKLTVEAVLPASGFTISWLVVPDSIQHFEVINRSDIDSLYTGNELSGISQTFTLTSFDSGKWNVPSFAIHFSLPQIDSSFNLYTDSLPVNVTYSPLDTTNHFKEIKPIIEVETNNPVWKWIVGAILILILVIVLIWYFRKRKKVKPLINNQSRSSAYEQAITALDALKKYPLSNREEIKIFHSKLSEIFKTYLSIKENTDYRNKTTSDILLILNDSNIDKEELSEMASALRCGDAVKFAKYLPSADENINALLSIKKMIELLNKNSF